jgi:M6 family metalloprotease-like protein
MLIVLVVGVACQITCQGATSTRVVVLAVELSDTPHIRDVKALQDLFSMARSYYLEASYDTQIFEFTIYGWFKLDRTTASYGRDSSLSIDDPNGDGSPDTHHLIQDAIDLADSTVNFSPYAYLIVVHSGSGQECTGNPDDIWSVAYLFGIWFKTKEKSFDKAAIVPETQVQGGNPIGVIVHEFGHLLGLPDLYSTSEQVGVWDVMGRGTWQGYPAGAIPSLFCAWSRMKLGWLTGNSVHTYTGGLDVVELMPLVAKEPGVKAVKIPLKDNESAYLIEYRIATGFDSALPHSGVLITRVKNTAPYVTVIRYLDRDLEEALWPSGSIFADPSENLYVGISMKPGGRIEVSINTGIPPPIFSSPMQNVSYA